VSISEKEIYDFLFFDFKNNACEVSLILHCTIFHQSVSFDRGLRYKKTLLSSFSTEKI
jgi:hypothetical protein